MLLNVSLDHEKWIIILTPLINKCYSSTATAKEIEGLICCLEQFLDVSLCGAPASVEIEKHVSKLHVLLERVK